MKNSNKQRKKGLLVGLIIAIIVSIIYGCGLLDRLECLVYDMKFRFRGGLKPDRRIVIIEIDEQSLKEIGRWPWDRRYHARLIDVLDDADARTIAMDILFAEPDMRDPLNNRALVDVTKAAGCVIYMVTCDTIEGYLKWIKPFPELARISAGLGHTNVELSKDGVVRQVRLIEDIKHERFFAFGLEIVRNYLGINKIGDLRNRGLRIPGRIMNINFSGSRFESISYSKVLAGEFPSDYFKDRIVLIGCVAKGAGDEKSTPFHTISNGIEVQANIVQNILTGNHIISSNKIFVIIIIFLLGMGTGILIEGLRLRIRYDTAIALLLLIVMVVISFLLFIYFRIHLPLSPLLLTLIFVSMGIILDRIFGVEQKINENMFEFLKTRPEREGMDDQIEVMGRFTRKLKELDQLKSDLMSMVAHEFRTPLASIKGYNRLVLDGDAGQINETQQGFLKTVDENADRLLNLIENFLDVAKIESGKIEMRYEQFSLKEIITTTIETFNEMAKKKNIYLHLNIPDNLPLINGDKERIRQVMDNLVSNAIKYTLTNGEVILEAMSTSENTWISVQDTGIGITQKDQSKVFDKFFRTKESRRTGESGTGLGLSIVKTIVEKHGGYITVESKPGEGSKFTFCLPQR
ncbi:MAG: CHASE2 and HATPase_c domain-containing protein [bacterium]|nr:CHASE2 and HATPase_c domain-containing protein [bacterium]